jgi:hypothetical protein
MKGLGTSNGGRSGNDAGRNDKEEERSQTFDHRPTIIAFVITGAAPKNRRRRTRL